MFTLFKKTLIYIKKNDILGFLKKKRNKNNF